MLTPIAASRCASCRTPASAFASIVPGRARSATPGAMTAPRTMKRCPSGSWMLAPRTVNDACGPGASTAGIRGDGERDERHRGREQELLPHTTHVSHRPRQLPHEPDGSFYAACVRIVSLVPSATEIIAALGLAGSLVGRSHECNYPPEVAAVPVVSASRIDTTSIASAADRPRGARRAGGRQAALRGRRRAARAPRAGPDRDPGPVRGVRRAERRGAARRPRRTSRRSRSTRATSTRSRSRSARSPATSAPRARASCSRRRCTTASTACTRRCAASPRPRVFVAEWLDPPFAAGHWVPEMVELAGGEEVLGRARERSFATTWEAVADAAPQLIVLAPCGFDLERTVSEAGGVPAHGRSRRRRRRRRGLLAPRPARGRGRRAARAPACIPMRSQRRRCRRASCIPA